MEHKRGQYAIELKGIDYKKLIDDNYLDTNFELINTNDEMSVYLKDNGQYTFYDINKHKITLWCTMIDAGNQKSLPTMTNIACWWCRYNFKTCPIGLPLKYISNNKNYEDFLNTNNIKYDNTDYFETEGIFCSFPCCKAYIVDNKFNSKYVNSVTLLSLLYYFLFNSFEYIPLAPSWMLLEKQNGTMDIDTFKKSFGKSSFKITPNIKRPLMLSSSTYIEEIKL